MTIALARRVNGLLRSNAVSTPNALEGGLEAGQIAPDFSAQTLEGERVSLSTFAQRSVAFIFISPSCKPCLERIPAIEALRPRAEQAGIHLVLVSVAGEAETQALANKTSIRLPILIAPRDSNTFMESYKVEGTPSYCLINADGKVRAAGYFLDTDVLIQDSELSLTKLGESPVAVSPS